MWREDKFLINRVDELMSIVSSGQIRRSDSRKMKNKTVVDIFAGCGGMSWGLQQCGYDVLLGIDNNPKYLQTFRRNFGEKRSLEIDIRLCEGKEILKMTNLERGELELLVGGPPCQGFSKNTPVRNRTLDSENNVLMREFLRLSREMFPQNIIMENVAEMKNGFGGEYTELIKTQLKELGYELIHHVFDASDYGIPQRRRRAFFLATRMGYSLQIPSPTHSASPSKEDDFFPLKKKVSVWEAIGDLPALKHGEKFPESNYPQEAETTYQKWMRGENKTLTNHIARKLAPKQFERLSALLPGQGLKDLPKHLKIKGGYSGVYGRLTKEMVCPTVTRWVFHPGSGRWGHPRDIRTITPREVARIQGFSDDFEFVGSYNDICGQLGNAVPAMLMKTILKTFRD